MPGYRSGFPYGPSSKKKKWPRPSCQSTTLVVRQPQVLGGCSLRVKSLPELGRKVRRVLLLLPGPVLPLAQLRCGASSRTRPWRRVAVHDARNGITVAPSASWRPLQRVRHLAPTTKASAKKGYATCLNLAVADVVAGCWLLVVGWWQFVVCCSLFVVCCRCLLVVCGVVWCGCWCGVVWCGVVWCGVVWCGMVWYGMVWYGWYGIG